MSLFFSGFGLGDLGSTAVRLGKVSLSMAAEKGTFTVSNLPIDDATGSIIPLALKPCNVREPDSATTDRLWTGYSADRGIARGDNDSLITGAARRWDGALVDANANLNFDVLSGAGWNRPAESVTARLDYLLAYPAFADRVVDSGHVVGSALLLSPADYRGQFPKNVLDDCSERIGYNYFVYFDPTTHTDSLGFFGRTYTGLSSTLRFTNVLGDIDNVTTFGATATLERDPSEVYSKIVLGWRGGFLTKTNTTTSSTFGIRGASAGKDNITTLAHASAWADQFLDDHSTETDTITVTVEMPKAYVNSVFAGQRAQIKFTHLHGYTSYTYVRIVQCTKAQDQETDQQMTVTLVMREPKSTHAGGGGGGGAPIPFQPCDPGSASTDPNIYVLSCEMLLSEGSPGPGWSCRVSKTLQEGTTYDIQIELDSNPGKIYISHAYWHTPSGGIVGPPPHANIGGQLTGNWATAPTYDSSSATGLTVGVGDGGAFYAEQATGDWGDAGGGLIAVGVLMTVTLTVTGGPDFVDCADVTPAYGQDVPWVCVNGDGSTTTFTTAYPYIAGSLEVRVDNVSILSGLTETSPAAGTFTLDFAPLGASGDSPAEQVCYRYKAGTA